MRHRFGLLLFIATVLFLTLQSSAVAAPAPGTTDHERYLKRKSRMDDTVSDHYWLARWCERKELRREALRHYDRVLELDPDHGATRKALGHRLSKGKWRLPPSERARRRKKQEKQEQVEKEPPRAGARMRLEYLVPSTQEDRYLKGNLRMFCQKLPIPVHLLTSKRPQRGDDYTCRVILRIEKGETNKFYGKDLSNNFTGFAKVEIRKPGQKRPVLVEKIEHRFTATTQLSEEEARSFAYRETVDAVVAKLRTHRFFRARGSIPEGAAATQAGRKNRS